MLLHLLRHGIAEDTAASRRDEDRALTTDGAKKLKQVLELAVAAGVQPDWIVSSPYRRAVQTAELAAKVLRYGKPVETDRCLTPESEPGEAWQLLRQRNARSVLIAGHQPHLGRLTAYLLRSPELSVDFKKAGLLHIGFAHVGVEPHGVLEWYLTPVVAKS